MPQTFLAQDSSRLYRGPGTSKVHVLTDPKLFCMQTKGQGVGAGCIDDGTGQPVKPPLTTENLLEDKEGRRDPSASSRGSSLQPLASADVRCSANVIAF